MDESRPLLPDDAARELYRSILCAGGRIRVDRVRPADAPAIGRLVDVGLLVLRAADGMYGAVNPRAVSERIGADLRAEGARLFARAEVVPELLDDLTRAYDAAPYRPGRTGGVRRIEGMPQIRHAIAQLMDDHPGEAMAVQPGGAVPAHLMEDALDSRRRFLARGGSMRTIYEPTARLDPATVRFAARETELGGVSRVLPGPFKQMAIFGQAAAVIPAAVDNSSAALVEDAAMVAFLVNVFEYQWQQAEGVNWAGLAAGNAEPLVPEQVGRLLSQGLTQRAIASRLGLSERTVAGHIARLRELYDAETLFQLGWQMRAARAGEPGA
ncbi:LuxR C-terminal-related transcriptional regulator [Kitasatospora sp. NPDC058170]|uniref:helix-turn-helix transcriptional regulator n=1 Tax=Kitasatospora sp. NPDC058170 TaxID=3346364 RepID=UPI0036DD9125